MLWQFGLFTLVGAAGFLVDAGVLLLLAKLLGMNIYLARVLSWLAAATFTWRLNRTLTFANRGGPILRQWLMFLAASAGGGLINIGLSSGLIAARMAPVPALACGALAGLLWNFLASRRFVFGNPARSDAPGRVVSGSIEHLLQRCSLRSCRHGLGGFQHRTPERTQHAARTGPEITHNAQRGGVLMLQGRRTTGMLLSLAFLVAGCGSGGDEADAGGARLIRDWIDSLASCN